MHSLISPRRVRTPNAPLPPPHGRSGHVMYRRFFSYAVRPKPSEGKVAIRVTAYDHDRRCGQAR